MTKPIFSARTLDLLKAMADHFDQGSNPFNSDFLSEHKVNLDECMGLSTLIGAAVLGFARVSPEIQSAILIASAAEEIAQNGAIDYVLLRTLAKGITDNDLERLAKAIHDAKP